MLGERGEASYDAGAPSRHRENKVLLFEVDPMNPWPDADPDLIRRFIRRTTFSILLVAAVLFAAAGTLRWPAAWVYLCFFAVLSFGGGFWLARHDPALLKERVGSLFQRDQKGWDKFWMIPMLVVWLGGFVLIGLDAVRFHWSHVPLFFQVLGFILLCLGSYLVMLTFKANSYAAPVVKIQRDRGHQVVTAGPYAYVRHPMYSGALLCAAGVPLLLGSWWGLAAGAFLLVAIAIRAVLEERTLKAELDGYADYAKRVRYRLVPLLW
jgi:protein-S-isoprenylcysteine O-methyltransferase Ste14